MSDTYTCKCGLVLETGKGHGRFLCPEENKYIIQCGFCAEEICRVGYSHSEAPKVSTLNGNMICRECKAKAYKFLIQENK